MTRDMTEPSAVVAFEPSLGRNTRAGDWEQLAQGTFRAATRAFEQGQHEQAADLLEVSILEAEELRDVYARWPDDTAAWIRQHGASQADLDTEISRLTSVIGPRAMAGIEAEWSDFTAAVASASSLCRAADRQAPSAIETVRCLWMAVHDRAVDRVSGLIDIAVRLVGEEHLGALWDHLMNDWYAAHEQRYDQRNQDWAESARQLMVAIVDGFHAHLTGPDRSGDIEIIHERDRVGFRFAPCGSGGRSLAAGITGGRPRAATPYGFAVTTTQHDWAWNTVGICSYCVHCCQLNEVMPIDRLGYPTRVIDAPTWPNEADNPSCTWWVYRDPSLVPDAVYQRVGRTPPRRTMPEGDLP